MIALIDLDSILYKAVYKVVSVREMRTALEVSESKDDAKQWLKEEVYHEGINRCENEILKILNHVDSLLGGDVISGSEVFITTAEKSFRKNLSKTYKSNRKKNDYVWLLREHYKMNGAFYDSSLEADDLISLRAKELGIGNYVLISMDKDLKQIGGHYWSFYSEKSKDMQGNYILNEFGIYETEYKQKQVDFITPKESELFFWTQMLVGDSSDNIKGVPKIGRKTAEKILNGKENLFTSVAREYLKRDLKEEFKTNYELLKLK